MTHELENKLVKPVKFYVEGGNLDFFFFFR